MIKSDPNLDTIWVYPKIDNLLHKQIIKEFNIHPATAQILLSREISSPETICKYLYAKLPDLNDPFLFKDMDKAISRIMKALEEKEGILIYGDKDVDGMTAAAVLTEFFNTIHAKIHYFIPDGNIQKKSALNEALNFSLRHDCSLIITVDCGITAAEEIENIVKHNIDVIITDHHEPTSKIPNCVATLNPKLIDSTYPDRKITGVGVAFKLAHALTEILVKKRKISRDKIDLKSFLDLVALGTISDMGALLEENRIFVKYGLKQLKKTKRIGLLKLAEVCDLNLKTVSPTEIASKIAPRLNSLGRIADPYKGVELLLVQDENTASALAKELNLYNIERQKIEKIASDDIENLLAQNAELLKDKAIVLYSNKWHPGIIPIITTRIMKLYHKPTMIITTEDGVGKGSIRTIKEFPLLPVLKQNEHLLINFGGHDFAAGLTIKEENISQLKKNFIELANNTLKSNDIKQKLYLDAPISFHELTFDFMESIKLLEPFGNDNPPPILYCEAIQSRPPKIIGKSHLKLYLLDKNNRMLEGIAFGMANRKNILKRKNLRLKIAFTPYINNFLNKSSIQLQIKDFKILHDKPKELP